MARVFIDGFESGHHDMWDDEDNATVVSSAGLDMDGDYCLDLNSSAEYLEINITADDEMYFALLYRPTSVDSEQILTVYNDSVALVNISRVPGGVLEAFRGTSDLLVSGSITPTEDATCLIEIHIKIADSGGRVETKVDGIADIDFTGDTKPDANTQFNRVRLGKGPRGSDSTYAYFDNFIMDDAAWIGDTKIQAIVPTGVGTTTGWTPSAGNNWDCVNERPASDVDYVNVNVVNIVDTYGAGNMTGSIASVKCLQAQSRTRTEGAPTPTNLQLAVRSGGTDYFSSSKAVPAAYKGLHSLWETDPATSVAWIESGVNAVEIGIKSIA